MPKIGATLNYGSRSLLKLRLYSLDERSPAPHLKALFQGNFIRNVPELRVLLQN